MNTNLLAALVVAWVAAALVLLGMILQFQFDLVLSVVILIGIAIVFAIVFSLDVYSTLPGKRRLSLFPIFKFKRYKQVYVIITFLQTFEGIIALGLGAEYFLNYYPQLIDLPPLYLTYLTVLFILVMTAGALFLTHAFYRLIQWGKKIPNMQP